MKLTFINNTGNFAELLREIEKGDCEVEVKSLETKTWPQVKAVHQLCSLLAPRLTEAYGVKFDLAAAKLNVKGHFGYMRAATEKERLNDALEMKAQFTGAGEKVTRKQFADWMAVSDAKTKPRSFADASKEEMIDLITKIEELGKTMGWEEVRLESAEKAAMVSYYDNLKE